MDFILFFAIVAAIWHAAVKRYWLAVVSAVLTSTIIVVLLGSSHLAALDSEVVKVVGLWLGESLLTSVLVGFVVHKLRAWKQLRGAGS